MILRNKYATKYLLTAGDIQTDPDRDNSYPDKKRPGLYSPGQSNFFIQKLNPFEIRIRTYVQDKPH